MDLRRFLVLSAAVVCTVPSLAADTKAPPASTKYLVMMVTNHEGKTIYKAVGDKEKEGIVKALNDDYQKARKAYQDAKKDFQKKNAGQKFEKTEPQKPATKVLKSDYKTYNEAAKAAFEYEKKSRSGDSGKDKDKDKNAKGDKGSSK